METKITDNEIIKALKCCFNEDFGQCEECPLKNKCDELFSCMPIKQKLTLDLINRQKAEIERLKDHNKQLRYDRKQITTKAIKEFAERLYKDRVSNDPVVIAVKAELKTITEPVKLEHNSLCETETYTKE